MEEKDAKRGETLKKYKRYVESELRRLNDGYNAFCGLDISEFEPEPPLKDGFSEEDLKELRLHFKNLKDPVKLRIFCESNGIDLSKYSKIKGL